jgi:hypothetical protein
MAKRRKEKRGATEPARLLGSWQRALLWFAWLGTLAWIFWNTDRESLGLSEFLCLAAAIAITIWVCRSPRGPVRVDLKDPNELTGTFVSRVNLPWLLGGALITLGGVAFLMRLITDLSSGRATWKDVVVDVERFFAEWLIERLTKGTDGDVTNTRMYVMVVLLPIGLLIAFFNLIPWLFRGRRFRIDKTGQVLLLDPYGWQPIRWSDYTKVEADGTTIDLWQDQTLAIQLPVARVFSEEHGTRVRAEVLKQAILRPVEAAGFVVETDSTAPDNTAPKRVSCWKAARPTEATAAK